MKIVDKIIKKQNDNKNNPGVIIAFLGDSVTQGYYDLYDGIVPLKNQLKKLVEATDYHVKCGIVGIIKLLHALSKCELSEYALKLLKKDGYPGYKLWMDNDATTLWKNRISIQIPIQKIIICIQILCPGLLKLLEE